MDFSRKYWYKDAVQYFFIKLRADMKFSPAYIYLPFITRIYFLKIATQVNST